MDLEVVGRHAMFFDDDAMAAFANSPEALVNWNSLSIDRYDVRHLLPGPLPPRPKRRPPPPSIEADLDYERYLDLPSSSSEDQDQAPDNELEAGNSAGFHAVAFSYENPNESTVMKDDDTETGFHPQFPVPENLLNNLPPNEKVHQIISRTATFVSKHGSQSEIVLRVKQGDNPTFGFLMPDHRLHAYFRYLVDHQELLTIENNGNSSMDNNRSQGLDQTGGALSLLGSVYGSGEDEEGTNENTQEVERKVSKDAVGAANSTATETEQAESSSYAAKKDGSISKNPVSSLKEKVPVIKRNHSISNVKAVAASREKTSDAADSVSNAADKSHTSVPQTTKISLPIVEPPSDLKRAIEKIAEFIVNNGKQFEAVLAEQDRAHGRFPFLVPSNRYHTYYLKVLQTTEESKLSGKVPQKQNSAGERNTAREASDDVSSGSLGSDLPCNTDRKEKFKMTVGSKSKKDGQDQISEDNHSQKVVSVDATAAAAILQAATRGIKKPNLDFFTKTSSGNGQGLGSDGGHLSSTGSLYSSQLQRLVENSNLKADISGSAPVAKAIAEHVAIAAAREADSSEAHMTKEEKLKADRLKRAKMFAAMLKNGVAPVKSETPRGLSVEPLGSGLSGSDAEAGSLVGKEREGSSVPFDVDNNSDKSQKSEEKHSVDNSDTSHKSKGKLAVDNNEQQKSKRKYRSRSEKQEEEEEEEEENTEDKTDHKKSRKEHRSHRSSHSSRDRHKHKHKRRHSSSKRHKDDSSSDDEDHHSRHHLEKDISDDDKYRSSRRRHRENSTSDKEHRRSRHRNKHYSSSDDDEQRHRSRNVRHKSSRYHAEKERDLEEGEIVVKSDKSKSKEVGSDSREASVARVPSQSPETTEVSDELRAKIRAMLMANL